jgi:hypothetical protein
MNLLRTAVLMNVAALACVRIALLVSVAAFGAGCAVGPRWHAPPAPIDAGYAPTPLP